MSTLSDLIREASFLQAGGGRKSPLQEISEINTAFKDIDFGSVARKTLESKKLGQEVEANEITLSEAKRKQSEAGAYQRLLDEKKIGKQSLLMAPAPSAEIQVEKEQGFPSISTMPSEEDIANLPLSVQEKLSEISKREADILKTDAETMLKLNPKTGVYTKDKSKGKFYFNGKEVDPSTIPADARIEDIGGDDKRDTRQSKFFLRQISRELKSDPVIKELKKQNVEFGDIQSLIKESENGNKIAFSQIGAKIAKAIEGGGRLTDEDVVRYVGSPQLARRIADKINLLIEGRPTEAMKDSTLQDLREITKVISERYEEKVSPIYEAALRDAMAFSDVSEDEAVKFLNVPNFDYKKFKNTNKQPLIEKRSGGQLMIDANGKKAYVYPNGAYEEVP